MFESIDLTLSALLVIYMLIIAYFANELPIVCKSALVATQAILLLGICYYSKSYHLWEIEEIFTVVIIVIIISELLDIILNMCMNKFNVKDKTIINIWRSIIMFFGINIINFFILSKLFEVSIKGYIYYLGGSCIIALLVLGNELRIDKFITKSLKKDSNKKELVSSILKNSCYIIIAFWFVGLVNYKIVGLLNVNKRERAIWNIYEVSTEGINNLEEVFGFNNFIIERQIRDAEESKVDNEKISRDIKEMVFIEESIIKLDDNNKEKFYTIISDLNERFEYISNTYIDYLDDEFYKIVAQISNEASRYIDKKEKIYNNKVPIEYISNLIYLLNKANEPWYELYKKEISDYNNKDDELVLEFNKDNKLQDLRLENDILVEELCYNIDLRRNKKDKNEVIYRLIEMEKIKPTVSHAEMIIGAIINQKYKYSLDEVISEDEKQRQVNNLINEYFTSYK